MTWGRCSYFGGRSDSHELPPARPGRDTDPVLLSAWNQMWSLCFPPRTDSHERIKDSIFLSVCTSWNPETALIRHDLKKKKYPFIIENVIFNQSGKNKIINPNVLITQLQQPSLTAISHSPVFLL